MKFIWTDIFTLKTDVRFYQVIFGIETIFGFETTSLPIQNQNYLTALQLLLSYIVFYHLVFYVLVTHTIVPRWVPTAGVYAAVAVAMTCWVTEWGAIARHLPFNRQPKEEETPQDTPATSES